MDRLRTFGIVLVTAIVTCALTSAFWFMAYSGIRVVGPSGSRVAAPNVKPPPDPTPRSELVIGPTGLAIPVVGVKADDLQDTYTQSRAGGARVHNAIDIMAPHGTPVVAAAPGTLEKLFDSKGGGGTTAYVRSADGKWMYYYAHLQAYAPGLHEGQAIRQGDAIGLVGSTGNANPAGPHLHFAINKMAEGEKWYDGTPINPYPLLAGGK
ncbi:MAG: peptidoglycan LD-endopeptidase LytH [Sphingomonadales bacterium]|jgi:murein DD-endopeptidase MepM/ murein hydrolase activator NlpD|nr:peptidoglycan LD-endopeptidase LytH [Sphingomonadales bacterium]